MVWLAFMCYVEYRGCASVGNIEALLFECNPLDVRGCRYGGCPVRVGLGCPCLSMSHLHFTYIYNQGVLLTFYPKRIPTMHSHTDGRGTRRPRRATASTSGAGRARRLAHTSTLRWEEPGVALATFQLPVHRLYLLSYCHIWDHSLLISDQSEHLFPDWLQHFFSVVDRRREGGGREGGGQPFVVWLINQALCCSNVTSLESYLHLFWYAAIFKFLCWTKPT